MRDRIKKVLMDVLELNDIPDGISQKTCEKWDSLHHLQLIIDLETEFNVSFEPEDIAAMHSLDVIEEKVKDLLD